LARYKSNICLKHLPFKATQERRRRRYTPVVNHALVQAFPFINDTLSQLVHILDFLG